MEIIKYKHTLTGVILALIPLFYLLFVEASERSLQGGLWHEFPYLLWAISALPMIFVVFGISADWHHARIRKREAEERLEVFRATLWASHHILNNFLNKLYLVQHSALQSGEFTEEASDLMGKMIQETASQLRDLSQAEPVTAKSIRKTVAP